LRRADPEIQRRCRQVLGVRLERDFRGKVKSLVDDPGNITIRLSGTGPIAQAATGSTPYSTTNAGVQIVSSFNPAYIPTDLTSGASTRCCQPAFAPADFSATQQQ
jgi:hypothetical protein